MLTSRGRRPSPEHMADQDDGARAAPSVDTTSTADFPSLGGSSVSRPLIPTPRYSARMSALMDSVEEFPSLGKPANPAPSTSHTWFKPIVREKPNVGRTVQKPIFTTLTPVRYKAPPPPSAASVSNPNHVFYYRFVTVQNWSASFLPAESNIGSIPEPSPASR